MATEDKSDDVRARPRARAGAAATLTEGNVARRGMAKGIAGTSSSGAVGRSTTTDTGVEVVTRQGRRVKLTGSIENPWSHSVPYVNGFKCNYCPLGIKGGGVTRLREHLGAIPGNVAACKNVPLNVKALMTDQVAFRRVRRKQNNDLRLFVEKEVLLANRGYGTYNRAEIPADEAAQVEMAVRESLRDYAMERGGSSPFGRTSGSGAASCSANQQTTLDRFYQSPSSSKTPFDIDLARSRAQAQPRVDVMLTGDAKEKLGKALAKWFHANDIPGRKADCPYFRAAIKLAQQLGEGVHIPYGREIDSPLLDMNYDDMEAHMAEFKDDWDEYGVTIMCDSWTGPTMMCIINFMIFCNGRMFFHKSVNATGCIQNADFIYDCLREVVVEEVGAKLVVQIVTDNSSNYKKACRQLIVEYPHITWQPCAAHTINLMLKDIGCFPEVVEVVNSAKRICRFFYNHNRLHAMMREKIGGELIRWNATRFGTVFIFLQSFWDRQDKFKAWMVSDDWTNSAWRDEDDHEFTYDCLTNRKWWSDIELVLKAVTPIYAVLGFADQQKSASISGFLPKMLRAVDEIRAFFMQKYLLSDTLMVAAATLDPEALYRCKLAKKPSSRHAEILALKKISSSSSKAAAAIDQFAFFTAKRGLFRGEEALQSALSGRMSVGFVMIVAFFGAIVSSFLLLNF